MTPTAANVTPPPLSEESRKLAIDWACGSDTGASSKAMCAAIFGVGVGKPTCYPLDSADFGRCYRFLLAVPEAKAHLSEVAKLSEKWSQLVAFWESLTRLFESRDMWGFRNTLQSIID